MPTEQELKLPVFFRELPLSIVDCSSFPNGKENKPPQILINNIVSNEFELEVLAGEKVQIPIQVIDNDSTGVGNGKQKITLSAYGSGVTDNLSVNGNCDSVINGSCAYLENTTAVLDTNFSPAKYVVSGQNGLTTNFTWQTNCNQAGTNGSKDYYFYFSVQDDNCPIPLTTAGVIKIKVLSNLNAVAPELNCVQQTPIGNELFWNSINGETLLEPDCYIGGFV